MTIADIPRRTRYDFSSGASYPFEFVVFGTNEVTITVTDEDGVETVLDPSLYTVTLNDNGGSVVLDESVECVQVVITSAVPQTQETIITNKGGFYPDVLNKAHDKLTALIQQVDEKVDRAIKVPVSSSATADEYKGEIEAIANEAKASAEQAASSAASAEARATSAESLASQASEDASDAVEQAQQAVTTAGNAVASASSAVTTANNASALSNDAVTTAMQAKTQAQTASSNASTAITRADAASASAQSSYQAVQSIQANLPSDIEEEVTRQIGSELEGTVETIVRQVAPQIIEETAASKDYVDTAVSGEATARASAVSAEASARSAADIALGQRIDNIGDNLADVATTGSYNDLTNKPTIPTVPSNVSAFTNDANYTSKTYVDEAIASVDALPDQTGQSGKVLGTDGTEASWVTPPSGMVIGQNIESLVPLTDAGIHLYDGSLIASGGMYDGFVQFASALQTSNPELFCTQAEFDLSVANYGVCSKFVASSSGIRLPKLYSENRYMVKAWKSGTEWYNLYSDGWCEQGGQKAGGNATYYLSIEFKDTTYYTDIFIDRASQTADCYQIVKGKTTTSVLTGWLGESGTWYACGYAKEVPDQEKIYRYICVATSVKTPIEANIDNIITDNNNKADKDFANVTKPYIVEMGENSAGWWKILSNGWVEQGGILLFDSSAAKEYTVQLPVEMRDADYNCRCSIFASTYKSDSTSANRNTVANYVAFPFSKTVTSFGTRGATAEMNILGLSWEVKGWKA